MDTKGKVEMKKNINESKGKKGLYIYGLQVLSDTRNFAS